ncbi:MAG: PKD domain-containing protein [Opitutales bacterium]|nr:PKD domain-containing protein [Opitutales bacterium]
MKLPNPLPSTGRCVAVCLLLLFVCADLTAQRRGLWVDADRVDELRTAVTVADSHHARAFAEMTSWIDANAVNIIEVPNRLGSNWNYDRSYLAQQAALRALLSSAPGDQAHYAEIAYDALFAMYDDPDSGGHQLLGSNQHLSKATVAMGFALGYEWAYEFWSTGQREWVRGKMVEALNGWTGLGHTNFGGQSSSNWLPVVRGAEVCMMLSAGEEADRPVRYGQLRTWLLNNANTHGPRGWGQEGNFYMSYGQIFAIPAMMAAQTIGDPGMKLALSQTQHHLVALYASMFSPSFDTVNWGVGGSLWDGGFASLSMGLAPEGEKPYFRWWFDRFMGVHNPAPESAKYDRDRQGRIWALLFYPEYAEAADPAEHFPLAIEDTGGFFMRSGWNDIDDVLVFLGTDREFYAPGWDAPDALSLVVLGHGNRYITGPGNTAYQAAAKDLFSTILVNDAVPSTGDTGSREWFGLAENGAYAIASGGSQYGNLGVSTAQRQLLADFSGDSGQEALLGLRDKLRSSGGEHEYRWQINTGQGEVAISSQEGRPAFTLTRPGNDGYLRGWVVHPADATLQTGSNRLFFNTTASDADIWVVMAVGNGTAPDAEITGSGLGATFSLNGVDLTYDESADRMVSSAVEFQPPPVASFTVSPVSGEAPHEVTVNAAGSNSPAGITEYVWDFGDGATATGSTAAHTYTDPGTHKISLRVTDALGRHEVANRTVVVGTRWPNASFSVSPSSGQPPLTVTFDPGPTSHPNGLPMVYEWDLGDGTTFTRTDNAAFTHTYEAGSFNPTLVVRDDNGGFDASRRSVTVANQPPVAVVDWSIGGGTAPLTVDFDGSGSYDPDGGPVSFLWDFGDGNTSTEVNPSHTFTAPGDYTVTLTVTDEFESTGSRSLPNPITVRDGSDPIAALDPSALPDLLRGLEYALYFNDISSGTGRMPFYLTPDLITLLRTGVMDNFRIWLSDRSDRYAFRYRGFIDIPEDGVYTFYIDSRNGALLNIAGEELVRNNTRFGTVNRWGTLTLEAGLHPVDFIYYANDSGSGPFYPYLAMTWSGPGFGQRQIDSDRLFWRPGRPEAAFVYSEAPDSAVSPTTFNFDAATSRAFGGDTIVDYEWTFPGDIVKTGRTASHAFTGGDHRVILNVTTDAGNTATSARTIHVPLREDYESAGGIDRSVMPGRIVRARGEFQPNGLATGAFDGDKSTRWLDLSLTSWIEVEFRNNAGDLTPYVISEYRFTSLALWNERDPYSWNLYGSNDGEDWTLLDSVTGNEFTGSNPRTNSFPIDNTTAYAIYRFDDIKATATSAAPDATGLNLIELIDYGTGDQPASVPPVAALDIANTAPAVGQSIPLDGSASYDPDGYPVYYHWDFGDGQTKQGWELPLANHTYNTAGDYTVILTVTDALGNSDSTSLGLSAAIEPNTDPVASYTVLSTAPTGWTEFTFDASESYDPDDDPVTFHWEFGDGVTAEGPVVTHTMGVGVYTPLLTVKDDRGGRGTFAQEIVVPMPADPPLSIGLNLAGRANEYEDALQSNEVAGLVPQAYWNNVGSEAAALLDSEGEPTSLAFTRAGGLSYGGHTPARSADHRLMRTGKGGTQTFVNVPYAVYDVYVYHSTRRESHDRDISWWVRLTSDSLTDTFYFRQSTFDWDGYYNISEARTASEAVDGHNVVVFRGLTDRNFTLENDSHQRRTMANAIQIVDASGGTIVPPVNPPQTPGELAGTALSSSVITLSWEEPAGIVEGYRVERAPAGTESWTQLAETEDTSHSDTGLTHTTTYRYRVLAFNSGGESDFAGPLDVTTQPPASDPPAAPDGFNATGTSATSVFVQWDAPDGPVDGYRLERSEGDSSLWNLLAETTALSLNDTDLMPGTVYRYRVRAHNEAGNSPWSEIATAQTAGEFGDGEEVPVVVWGPGQYYNNEDGSGAWTGLPGVTQGSAVIMGAETGYRARPYGAAALSPSYRPNSPPSGRFNLAGAAFNSLENTGAPTLHFRLDGRAEGSTLTQIVWSTPTSGSAYGALMIWWSKEDFLAGYDAEPLSAERTFAAVDVNAPYHLLVRQNGQYYISQLVTGSGSAQLAAQTWTPYDPVGGGTTGFFANRSEDQLFPAGGLAFAPVELDDIEAVGIYTERINTTANRGFALREFRIVTVLPDADEPAEGSFGAWLARGGFSESEMDDPARTGPAADPDRTGVANLLRHAFGMERDTPLAGWLPRAWQENDGGERYLRFHYRRNTEAEDIAVSVRQSGDLSAWNPLESAWTFTAEPANGINGVEDVTLHLDRALEPGETLFLRVDVEMEE